MKLLPRTGPFHTSYFVLCSPSSMLSCAGGSPQSRSLAFPTPGYGILRNPSQEDDTGPRESGEEATTPSEAEKRGRGCHRLSLHATLMISPREALVSFDRRTRQARPMTLESSFYPR